AHVRLGHTSEACAAAEEALLHEPPTPQLLQQLLWKAACVYAQAAGKLNPNSSVGGRRIAAKQAQDQEPARQVLPRALDLCPSRKERGAFWQEHIETELALNPLRRDPGFYRLEADYRP